MDSIEDMAVRPLVIARHARPGAVSDEDKALFREHERELLARRWRLFAPIVSVFFILTDAASLLSPHFPAAPVITAAMVTVMAGMYLLGRFNAPRHVMGWASVVSAILAGPYIAIACVETGRFLSLQVLAMTVLIAVLPGIFSLSLLEAVVAMGGSLAAWAGMCLFYKTTGPVSLDGLDISGTYLLFLCIVTVVANQSNRRVRFREFIGRRELERMHRFAVEEVLCRHLPPRYVERVLSGEHPLDGPPERRLVTVVFADIVAFSPLSDGLPTEDLARLMARFYDAMAAVAFEHGATLDKFIGDAVMALVGAPDPMPADEQARRAVAMAQAWHRAARELVWPGSDGRGLRLRVGIHQESVAVGAFGGRLRSDYTVLGRGVNIAARLEQRCDPGAVLVSEAVFRHLAPTPGAARPLGELGLRGIPTPVRCYTLPGTEEVELPRVVGAA